MKGPERRRLLSPLREKGRWVATRVGSDAEERLLDRAAAEEVLPVLQKVLARDRNRMEPHDPERARRYIQLAQALYDSRRISEAEYIFYVMFQCETVNDGRWLEDAYDEELSRLTARMDAIRTAQGLNRDEYWGKGEGPKEHQDLEEHYSRVLNRRLVDVMLEFGLEELAESMTSDAKSVDRLRERGRRAVFHRDEHIPALRDAVAALEENAARAAEGGAFLAGIVALGAALEGRLVLRCLKAPVKAERCAQKLPRRVRPRTGWTPAEWSFSVLIDVCVEAGWLGAIETDRGVYSAPALAGLLQDMRNEVHPGRAIRSRPWAERSERDYTDAQDLYGMVVSAL